MSTITIGQRLAELRRAAGLTQEQLGRGLGPDGTDVGGAAVSAWEVGRNKIPSDQIPEICARLKCSSDQLFGMRGPRAMSTEKVGAQ